MKRKLLNIYRKQSFKPNLLSVVINPFYFIRKGLYAGIEANVTYMNGSMMDFGCGRKPYFDLFNVEEYLGLDIEQSGHAHINEDIDVFYDGKTLPFEDERFDCVFSSEVFEHVFNLTDILVELHRVLRPGGKMLVTVPFVWDEHEIPYDYARYTSYGCKSLLEEHGFKVIKFTKSTNYVETIIQMWMAYLYQHVLPANTVLKLILTPFVIAPFTLIGILLSKILPKSDTFYNNNIAVVEKVDK